MSEHAKFLGEGVNCAYCCEHKIGVTAETVKAISLEEVYFDETEIVIDPSKSIKDQVWPAIEAHLPEVYDAIKCPMCGETADPEWNEDIISGSLWECTNCNEIHDSEEDAEACCAYQRQYAQHFARQQQTNVMNARMLLEQSGYVVVPVNQQQTADEILKDL